MGEKETVFVYFYFHSELPLLGAGNIRVGFETEAILSELLNTVYCVLCAGYRRCVLDAVSVQSVRRVL